MAGEGKHIKFRLHVDEFGTDGKRTRSSVHSLGGDLPAGDNRYQKYMLDVVARALTLGGGGGDGDRLMCSDMGTLFDAGGNVMLANK